jgi:hypothetical protein
MTIYVLNTLVIPIDFERYERVTVKIRKASVEEVRRLLQGNDFVSAVGHQATADLLTSLLQIPVQFNRVAIKAAPGDVLIHFVLKTRVPEGKVLTLEELLELPFDFAISEIEEVTRSD